MPEVVLSEPMSRKNGTQTATMVMVKSLKPSDGMFDMPKTEVTNVRGRKKIETCNG